MQISVTGLAWYKEDQWNDFKKYCTDGDTMSETYNSLLKGALNAIQQMKQRNIKLYKIVIDLTEFKEHCLEKNLEPNGNARTEFVNLKVFQNYKTGTLEPLCNSYITSKSTRTPICKRHLCSSLISL